MRLFSADEERVEKYRDLASGRFDFRCPCMDCEYEGKTFDQIRGHINGKVPYDEDHAAVGPVKKWMFLR